MIQTFLSIRLEREEGRECNGRGGRCTYWEAIICVGGTGGTQQETSLVRNLK